MGETNHSKEASVTTLPTDLVHILQTVTKTKIDFVFAVNQLVDYILDNGISFDGQDMLLDKIEGLSEFQTPHRVVDAPELVIYPDQWLVTYKDENVYLTSTEYKLVRHLCRRPKVIRTRDELLDIAYPSIESEPDQDRSIDSHIKRIRKKFKKIDPKFPYICTIYGGGYCLIRG